MRTTSARPALQLPTASVDDIRDQFPAMARRHNGVPVAYLDGPGGTQVPSYVANRVSDYLLNHNANTHWKYPTSTETDAMITRARRSLAAFVNGAPDEVAFGLNMTTITFHLARALGRSWGPTDEVLITELDHHGNVAPWRALEKERGVKIVVAKMRAEDGTLDLEDVERKIGPNTRLVAVGAASNALGTIVDIPHVAAMARAQHALVFVDAVHYAPHELVDVRGLGADFVAMSAYKFYGPHVGVLWGKRILLEMLDVPKLAPAPDDAPERLETGTQNHEGIIGAGAAVEWLAMLAGLTSGKPPKLDDKASMRAALEASFVMLHTEGTRLFAQLWNGLGAIKSVTRFGLPAGARRTPTISFRVAGVSCDDVAVALADKGLFVSHGDFYATTIIERLGGWPDGVVRVGCSAYTTAEEITRVLEAVDSLSG